MSDDFSVFVEPFQTLTSTSAERITLGPDGAEVRETWERRPDGSYAWRFYRPLTDDERSTLLGVPEGEQGVRLPTQDE
jgi:hypothetical protein